MKSLNDIRDFQNTVLEDCGKSSKNEERYCRLCGKREKRSICGYGPAGWDKYSVEDASDAEKEAAAVDAGIVSEQATVDEETTTPKFAGNYQGPLYAPHPDLAEKRRELGLDEGAAWTKKSGKNKEGGLNEKGRKSYERENPGSDLKAPSKKVGNPRRASFCARMKGMKSKLTSKKTASDPDSRINKSLRKWNC